MSKPFWQYKTEQRPHEVAFYWAEAHMAQRALECGEVDYEYSVQGTLKGMKVEDLVKAVEAMGLRLFYHKMWTPTNRDDYYFLISDDAAVWIDITRKNGAIIFNSHTVDLEKAETFKEICTNNISRSSTKGAVYALVSTQQGPQLRQFGVGGENFIEGNYRPEVVKEYRHVAEDLNNDEPCGRIVILDGPPGTGKTHMIRALMNEVPKGKFILIQSSMISALGAPDFLTALMREQRAGYPMILILEDADEALSSRKADNISAISALLNFSDGIFGSLMDMRIIASTNIELQDLDKAVMRDGRLCRRIEVGMLDHTQAEEVFFRLAGKPSGGLFTSGNFYPLGTVYKLAKGGQSGSFEVKKAKGKIGFSVEHEPTPAEEAGMQPGEYGTSGNKLYQIDQDGNPVEVGTIDNPHIGSKFDPDDFDDDDLIDEDPDDDFDDDEPFIEDDEDED